MRVVIRGVSDEGRSDTKLNHIFIILKTDYWSAQEKISQLAEKLSEEESKYADKEKALGLFQIIKKYKLRILKNHLT